MRWMTGVRFGAGNLSSCSRAETGSGVHPPCYSTGTVVKRPKRVADHSSPSSAEVKNAWSYASTSTIIHNGVVLN